MGEPALDYHSCYRGFYLGIEAKAQGNLPTQRQIRTMRSIRDAGGAVFLIDDPEGPDIGQLIGWFVEPVRGFSSKLATYWMAQGIVKGDTLDDISDD